MKVSAQEIQDSIKSAQYYRFPGTTVTVCCLTLDNGFTAVGQAACVDPAEFNESLGIAISHKDAENKVWGYLGFRLAEKLATQKEG
jgi:hypothetical protein